MVKFLLLAILASPTTNVPTDTVRLHEVTVSARRLPVEMKAGKTVYNLDSSIAGQQGNLYDAMRMLPGVQTRQSGNLLLYGQSGVIILMDGKEIRLAGESLTGFLRGIPVTEIDKIEITDNPAADFDASGKAGVINVIRKRNSPRGLAMNSAAGYSCTDTRSSGYGNLSVNIRHNRANLHAGYAFNKGSDPEKVDIERRFVEIEDFRMSQTSARNSLYTVHDLSLSGEYEIRKETEIFVRLHCNLPKRARQENMHSEFYSFQQIPDSSTSTSTATKIRERTIKGDIGIICRNKEGIGYDASADFMLFGNKDLQEQISDNIPNLHGRRRTDIRIYNIRANIGFRITRMWTIRAGCKETKITIDNNSSYRHMPQLYNKSGYDENIAAAYVQTELKPDEKASVEAGLRIENTNVSLSSVSEASVKHCYTDLFPFFRLQYGWRRIHRIAMMYGKRIVRPDYRDINPFITINDKYLYEQGNTNLQPEFSHNTEITYILKSRFRFSLYGTYTSQPIIKSYVANADGVVKVFPMNMSAGLSGGLRASIANIELCRNWSVSANILMSFYKYTYKVSGTRYHSQRLVPIANTVHRIRIPYETDIEISAAWQGYMPQGQAIVSPYWSVSAGIGKSFIGNTLKARIFAENMLSSQHIRINVANPTQYGWYSETLYPRVGISLTYSFHRGKKPKAYINKSESDEIKRINR